MKKINILKENSKFDNIIKNGKPFKYKDYIIYKENTNDVYKFGLSVGKKIGNAVVRNRIKRQLRMILDENDYQKGFICIIIVKKGVLLKTFTEKKEDLNYIIDRMQIKKEKKNEK